MRKTLLYNNNFTTILLPFIVSMAFVLQSFAQQTKTVFVGQGHGSVLSPSVVSITTSDTVIFQWVAGSYTVSSEENAVFNHNLNSYNTSFKVPGSALGTGTFSFNCITRGSGANTPGTVIVGHSGNSLSEIRERTEIGLSPNPFEDHVSFVVNNRSVTDVKISDLIGNEVLAVNLAGKQHNVTYKVDTSNLKPGIYFCTFYSDKSVVETKKIFKRN